MPSWFTPASVLSSGWLKSGTDVALITSSDRVLAGLASSDVASSKFVVKDRLSVSNATFNASYLELYTDGSLTYISSLKSGTGSYRDISIQAGGSEKIRITTTGYIGIGTSTPTTPLEVVRGSDGYVFYATRSSGANFGVYATTTYLSLGAQSNHYLNFLTNNTTRMTILADGKVGIGTTTPSSVLSVVGITRLQTSLTVGADADPTSGYKLDVRGHGYFSSGGAETHITVTSNGTLTIRNTSSAIAGIYAPAAGTLELGIGDGDQRLMITNAGNVQVGIVADQGYKFYINGSIKTPHFTITTGGTFTLSGASGWISGTLLVGDVASMTPDIAMYVASTTKGFMPPRMTTAQRDAIASPTEGLIIFNTSTRKLNVKGLGAWEVVTSA